MAEIYWLQRIGNLSILFTAGFSIFTVLFSIVLVCSIIVYNEDGSKSEKFAKMKKLIRKVSLFYLFFIMGIVFIPTKKEMYAIYGIGGTIDYIRSSDKAKQLPDKCIDALTRYVDSIEKEEKKKEDKE